MAQVVPSIRNGTGSGNKGSKRNPTESLLPCVGGARGSSEHSCSALQDTGAALT